jgi:hypothetical protein
MVEIESAPPAAAASTLAASEHPSTRSKSPDARRGAGCRLAADGGRRNAGRSRFCATWSSSWNGLDPAATDQRRELYIQGSLGVRRMALANPLLDFDDLLFVKRVPGSFTHMSDQYYGWFSRPGGGVFILEDFKSDQPRLRC